MSQKSYAKALFQIRFDHRRSNSDAAPGYRLVIGIQPVKLVGICHPRNLKRLLPQEKPFGQFAVHADCPGDKFEAFGVKTRRKPRGGALFCTRKIWPGESPRHRYPRIPSSPTSQPFPFRRSLCLDAFSKRATNDSDNAKYASQPACVNGSICSFQTARPAKSSAVGRGRSRSGRRFCCALALRLRDRGNAARSSLAVRCRGEANVPSKDRPKICR